MKKRSLAIVMALAIAGSMTGCGSKGEEAKEAATAASTAKAETGGGETAGSETGGTESAGAQAEEKQEGPSGEPVRIGMTAVLTGDRSLEGEYARNTAEILTEEINAAGGVLGRPLEIVIEDALGTDVGAVNAFRKLASDDSITAIVGSNSSNDNIAIASSVAELKVLTTAQGSSPKLKAVCEENPWMFQIRACDQTLCGALMKYAVEEAGYKSFAVIHDTETASSDQARLFTEALATYGIEPVITVPFTSGTKDFSSHLAQIQAKNPEAVIAASFHTEAAILLQQMRSMGMEQAVFGSNAYGDPVTIGLAKDAINDVYSVNAWVPNTPNERGAAFSKKYTERYGAECAQSASQVYDHVSIICEAIERAGTTDRQAVRDAMQGIDRYEGIITTYDCRTNGDCGRGGLIVQVKDQVPTILQELYFEKEAR